MTKTKISSYWNEFIPKSWHFFKGNYSWGFFRHDLVAGITVGVVALPLAMAFAIASGVTPERGLYTAIIAGFLISFLGGSRLQIGGPTGAFVVIIYGIIERNGYDGLVVATFLAAIILLIAAFARLGTLIKYIPYPLVIGFTTGIAFVIFSSQIKDFFGLTVEHLPADFIPKWMALVAAFPTLHVPTMIAAFGTLALILFIRRFFPKIPWAMVAVAIVTLISWYFSLPLETIATRFGEIPRLLPTPSLGHITMSFSEFDQLVPDAITIAFLAGIESLLSAVVADGMAGTQHKSNCELMAQGVANLSSVFFGGIPATGALARTATNIKTGAKTPIAGMIHAVTLFLIILFFAPLVSEIPLATLSAVLMVVAWNMAELSHFRHLFKAPRSDIIVLLTTFFLTVLVDLTAAVEVGMILALFFFMKQMAGFSSIMPFAKKAKKVDELDHFDETKLPPDVELYEIMGPFFFGVVDTLKHILSNLEPNPKVFILLMNKVTVIDASGMHALREFHFQCQKANIRLFLVGTQKPLYDTLKDFGLVSLIGKSHFFETLSSALKASPN